MTTLSQFISKIKCKIPSVEIRFRYPTLFLVFADKSFAAIPTEDREAVFFRDNEINPLDADAAICSGGIQLILCTPAERARDYAFLDAPGATSHWAEFLANPEANPPAPMSPSCRFVHFYGFKGGQARSSVLAMLAQSLALNGYCVLALDADLEAPSLHTLFGVPSPPHLQLCWVARCIAWHPPLKQFSSPPRERDEWTFSHADPRTMPMISTQPTLRFMLPSILQLLRRLSVRSPTKGLGM